MSEDVLGPACALVLAHQDTGVIACDSELRVVGMTERARALLEPHGYVHALLPATIATAARTSLHARVAQRVDGRPAIYLTAIAASLPSVDVVISIHAEIVRGSALFDVLRRRFDLTIRDAQLAHLALLGHTNKQIADRLALTESTVKSYMHHLFERLGIHSRAELLGIVEQIRAEP